MSAGLLDQPAASLGAGARGQQVIDQQDALFRIDQRLVALENVGVVFVQAILEVPVVKGIAAGL